jgi:hypothetical protein
MMCSSVSNPLRRRRKRGVPARVRIAAKTGSSRSAAIPASSPSGA